MKRRIFIIIATLCTTLTSMGQTATNVLDQTAKTLQNSGGIEAAFEATSFQGTEEKGTTAGVIYVKGDKFKINTPDGDIWFDGKTQWSLYKNSDEVNVSNPSEQELQSINPYTFINLYKNGFDHSMSKTTYNGHPCYNVRLTPQKVYHIREMRIVIDQKTFLPYSIRIKKDNDWFRIRINKIKTGNKWKDSFFKFEAKDHPELEIIDLR